MTSNTHFRYFKPVNGENLEIYRYISPTELPGNTKNKMIGSKVLLHSKYFKFKVVQRHAVPSAPAVQHKHHPLAIAGFLKYKMNWFQSQIVIKL